MQDVLFRVTRVVNLNRESYDVYIGRAGCGHDGYFGNPIRVGFPCQICMKTHQRGGDTLSCYEWYLEERLSSDQEFQERVCLLSGRTIGCFCKPGPCHGDILAQHADKLANVETLEDTLSLFRL